MKKGYFGTEGRFSCPPDDGLIVPLATLLARGAAMVS